MAQNTRTSNLDEFAHEEGPPSGGRRSRHRQPWWREPKYLGVAAVGGAVILILLSLALWGGETRQEAKLEDMAERMESMQTRLKKLEFQQSMILENVNDLQESGSQALQEDLQNLRNAVVELREQYQVIAGRVEERPEAEPAEAAEAPGEEVTRHTVQAGETLFSISQRYGVSVEELREWNDLGPEEFIHPDQELIVGE